MEKPPSNLSETPIIFAHRGASGYAHENSFEAFDKAIELGAHGLEFDCWLTRDRRVIIQHDRFFYHKVSKSYFNFNRLKLSEIKKLTLPNGELIPTLEEFCERYGTMPRRFSNSKNSYLFFSIDLQDNRVGAYLIPILAKYGLINRTFLCSGTLWKIRNLRSRFPEINLRFIASNLEYQIQPEHLAPNAKIHRIGIEGFNIQAMKFKIEYQKMLKAAGMKLFIWDLHSRTLLRKYLAYNPDAIYTNYPDLAHKLLEKRNSSEE
ncbi:MAG: glycerophosphodiester phosphodiesterase [Promethearchaeota archaeon]